MPQPNFSKIDELQDPAVAEAPTDEPSSESQAVQNAGGTLAAASPVAAAPPSQLFTHYDAVIKDLEAKGDEIDRLIAVLRVLQLGAR